MFECASETYSSYIAVSIGKTSDNSKQLESDSALTIEIEYTAGELTARYSLRVSGCVRG